MTTISKSSATINAAISRAEIMHTYANARCNQYSLPFQYLNDTPEILPISDALSLYNITERDIIEMHQSGTPLRVFRQKRKQKNACIIVRHDAVSVRIFKTSDKIITKN